MKRQLNIALIRKKYQSGGGGAEKTAAYFVEKFTARGHRITVFSERFEAAESEAVTWHKVPVSILPNLCGTTAFHRQTQKILSRGGLRKHFDIVYSMCRTFPVDIFRVTEQLHAKWLPIGYSRLAALNPRHRTILKLEKETFSPSHTGMVVASSQLIKRQIIEEFSYPAERIKVIYNGMDHNRFFPAEPAEKAAARRRIDLADDRHIALFCAGNFHIKGLAEAIKAVAALREELRHKTILLVVGNDNPAQYRKLAGKCGIAEQLIFAGAQSNMRDYYIAADILLYPSYYETFSNVCLEAMGCGLPVITTRQIGAYELITDGVNGFAVADHTCIAEISRLLGRFLELSPAEKSSFSTAAAAAVRDFTWERHINQLEELFLEVAAAKSPLNQT